MSSFSDSESDKGSSWSTSIESSSFESDLWLRDELALELVLALDEELELDFCEELEDEKPSFV